MLVSSGKRVHVFEELDGLPFRLGRHHVADARSVPYMVEAQPPWYRQSIVPKEWLPAIPTLDQSHLHEQQILDEPGNPESLGSCTGNGGTYALSAVLGTAGLQNAQLNGIGLTNYQPQGNERFAIELYHEATKVDGIGDPWPANDRGSSGLAICQVLKSVGLVSGYNWASTVRGVGVLLQHQGLLIGVPWFSSWFEPDASGFVDASSIWGPVVGGHELFVEALERWDDRDPAKSVVRFHNSWGGSWGDAGRGRMRLSTYVKLASQIDVKALKPRA